jgi:hypothetical protein
LQIGLKRTVPSQLRCSRSRVCSEKRCTSARRTSLLLSRAPVRNHVQRRGPRGVLADNQEAFPVRSNIPAHGPGANSGIHHLGAEKSVWSAGLESGVGAHVHRHHLLVGRNVEQLFPITPPTGHYAAAPRHHPSAFVRSGRKGNDIDLVLTRFIRRVRDPMSVGRELPLVFRSRHLRQHQRMWVRRSDRQRKQVRPCSRIDLRIDKVAPIRRPALGRCASSKSRTGPVPPDD